MTGSSHPVTFLRSTSPWIQAVLVVTALSGFSTRPAMAQPDRASAPIVVRTEQGNPLHCYPTGQTFTCQPQSTTSPASTPQEFRHLDRQSPLDATVPQSLDGASDMLLKLLYLGLPGTVLLGICLRSLYQRRQLAKKRAFLESLERIWERSAQY
ncbi:MAG TPA: hypothetical protein DCE56_02695 [Cyanobacteria bacterium UBA8553]|nr:hypothetical protein [Cyanobacteria bacterium UBA8553]